MYHHTQSIIFRAYETNKETHNLWLITQKDNRMYLSQVQVFVQCSIIYFKLTLDEHIICIFNLLLISLKLSILGPSFEPDDDDFFAKKKQ